MDAAVTRQFRAAAIFEVLLRASLGGIFIYAGVLKVVDAQQFAVDVQNYQLTPWLDRWALGVTSWTISIVIAMYLPWLELFAGLALLARRLYRGALLASGALAIVFLAAIGSAWWRGLDITCGCFGREENATNFGAHVALNLAMLAATAALALFERRASPAHP